MFLRFKILLFFLALFALIPETNAQEIVEDDNWFYMGGDYSGAQRITYQLKTFTMEDVTVAKERLKSIRTAGYDGEWEGVYSHFAGIGDFQMAWNAKSGYFRFYYYHTMKQLDFGKVVETKDGFWFESERKGPAAREFLLKVRFGARRYLVPFEYLPKFCRLAAGREPWSNVLDYDDWLHDADREKPVSGLPIVDPRYAKFVKSPIEAKIIVVGGNFPDLEYDGTISKDRFRKRITIDAGSNRGVLRGMNFFVDYLGEWIAIERVSRKRSVGYLERSIDEKRVECWNQELGSGMPIPCKNPRVGLTVRTKPSGYQF